MERLDETLQFALTMERKSRQYYLEAAQTVQNAVVRIVLESLANDELEHERAIGRFYAALEKHQGWPPPSAEETSGELPEHLENILNNTAGSAGKDTTFAGVYETAHGLEIQSREYYQSQADLADDRRLAELFRFLARVEHAHARALETMLMGMQVGV